MNVDLLIVFIILGITILLFVSERLRLDLVAILAVLALMLAGILTPAEALAGFSDTTVLVIAGLFVVGTGLFRTGVANTVGNWLARVAGTGEMRLLTMIMIVAAALSSFMSSTGTAAIFLPIVVSLAWSARISPSRLLIPLAIASLVGGMLTLIGTPPNIVVSDYLSSVGLEPFGFFAFTPVGLVMLLVSIAFLSLIGRHLLSPRAAVAAAQVDDMEAPSLDDLASAYGLAESVYRLRVRRNSPLVGRTLAQLDLPRRYDVIVLELQSWTPDRDLPTAPIPVGPETYVNEHDILRVRGTSEAVTRLAREQSLGIRPAEELGGRFMAAELGLVEVILPPRSRLNGQTLADAHFREKYGVTVLGIMRRGQPLPEEIATMKLRFGDTLLVQGTWQQIRVLTDERRDFLVVGQPREMLAMQRSSDRAPHAVLILVGMLVLMITGIVPTVVAVLLAAAAMVLWGCLSMEDAYGNMNWESLVLIAGMLPMATALEKTGGIDVIATALTSSFAGTGPLLLMAALFLLTAVLSQVISNTATTVLVTPIAYQTAISLGVSPYPLLMIVAVAASTAFATPIASPVNMLVLGPGNYRFIDFAKVGIPLQVLILIASLAVVPVLFPF